MFRFKLTGYSFKRPNIYIVTNFWFIPIDFFQNIFLNFV